MGVKYRYPLIFTAGFLLLWESYVYFTGKEKWLLPAPSDIAAAFPGMLPLLVEHGRYTLLAAVVGFALAIAVALLLAVLMDISPVLRQGIYPLLVISQTIPIISVAPLFIIWFGYGLLPKVIVVALVCFFPLVVSVIQGMEAVDRDMVNLLRVMGASTWQIIKEVKLPAALPSFFAGLKIAGTYSIMGAVIGEWLGAAKGLGLFMTRAMHSYQYDRLFSAIIVVSLLSVLLFMIIEVIGRLVIPWHYKKGE
ncbi:ABC-type nitrate/sulfonate/bicarbonate transport system permease component [Desulfohalotomaculum tongense]|uniref:ABC transporter permease n=1 Tax=Desulforadius tongensis TaxID=1216062 RepID=UPI00195D6487|nr:ABC transporter permease [Desulforadius tongensis]MBM7855542.1 ABC-type nitrate/sulfonate/bicarbonate transport system permease component [Desulforadius tongensis]